jgi:protein phosphatase
VVGDQITIAHVGDSRAYFIYPNGSMKAVTQDHSLVRRLVELGQLSEEQAMNFPQKNVLYKAVGQPEPIRPDIFSHPIPRPGYLVLCSDGLWGVVEHEQIVNIIGSSSSPNEACRLLVDAANNAGGPDNISVIIVQFL